MRTSCRFAMAVHVLAVLAYKDGDRVTSSLLASSVNTNPVIIRRLLLVLQRNNLIDTRKGVGSGSRLSRAPVQINLAEVFRAVEGQEEFVMPRGKPNQSCPVGSCIQASIAKVFSSTRGALERELAKTTLADLINSVRACCPKTTDHHR
jgi:Rrf2 family protein